MTMPIAPPLAGVLRAIARHHTATADLFNELAKFSHASAPALSADPHASKPDLAGIKGQVLECLQPPKSEPAACSGADADPTPEEVAEEGVDWNTIDPETPLSREDQQAIFDQIKALPAAHLAKFVADFKAEYGATRGRGGRETVQDRIVQWKHAHWFNAWVLANGEGA